jgi:hypothetical protein
MTLRKIRTYSSKQRKYEGKKTARRKDKKGYEYERPLYYKPSSPLGVGFDFSKSPELQAHRAKVFVKQEPQMEEYYEGFDNCVKGVGF